MRNLSEVNDPVLQGDGENHEYKIWNPIQKLLHFKAHNEVIKTFWFNPINTFWMSRWINLRWKDEDFVIIHVVVSIKPESITRSPPSSLLIHLTILAAYQHFRKTLIIAASSSNVNPVRNYHRGATKLASCLHLINILSNQCTLSVCSGRSRAEGVFLQPPVLMGRAFKLNCQTSHSTGEEFSTKQKQHDRI